MNRILGALFALVVIAGTASGQSQQPPPASLGGYDQYGNPYQPQNRTSFETGNWTFLTAQYSNTTTAFTSSGLVLPPVLTGVTIPGRCVIFWQTAATGTTLTVGLGMSNAGSSVQVLNTSHTGLNGATLADTPFTVSGTTVTAISPAMTPGAATTTYRDDIDMLLTPGSGTTIVTIYGKSGTGASAVTFQPGSKCVWGS